MAFRVTRALVVIRDLGYREGQDVVIGRRLAEGRSERLDELAAEPVRLKVDVIVAVTTLPSLAAKRATSTIPIVMGGPADPVGIGNSVGRPRTCSRKEAST
ncbi:MAG TPA: ABC transporter substrate binding protein [Methylomirabilota bacterium]|jgi:putative ABC transport system substrate-binding protein|nr:ABC transporter substrate binding protein [Methylomirabilota bacterium]